MVPPPDARRPRGFPLLAWLVIVAVVIGVVVSQMMLAAQAPQSGAGGTPPRNSVEIVLFNAQSKTLVGTAETWPSERATMYRDAQMLNQGTLEQRLGFVAMAYELADADEARMQFGELESLIAEYQPELTESQQQLLGIVQKVYGEGDLGALPEAYAAPEDPAAPERDIETGAIELTPQEQDALSYQLGWLGELIVSHTEPGQPQQRESLLWKAKLVTYSFFAFIGLVAVLGVLGFIGLAVMAILTAIGVVKLRFRRLPSDRGVYVETFAVWIVLFFVLQIAGDMAMQGQYVLETALVAFFMSMIALLWPVMRGIPWREVRQDFGLHSGKGIFVEVMAGVASYAMTLPIAAVGLLLTLALMGIVQAFSQVSGEEFSPFAPSGFPAHPIVELVGGGGWHGRIMLLLVAAVAAPIVEETFFRGVLYRALRNGSVKWLRFMSVVMSTLVVSLIFAVIHPQGLLAVPALGALATGMTLAREWRDSLIAPMTVHAISNGLVMSLLIAISA